MNKKFIKIGFGVLVVILFFWKFFQSLASIQKNNGKASKTGHCESNPGQFKTARISIKEIDNRRWDLITRTLQSFQKENGMLDMGKLEFVEDGDSFIIKYYSENKI